MKVKQVVTMKFSSGSTSYYGLDFYDPDGNELSVTMSDDELIAFAKCINSKVQRIEKDRAERAAELEAERAAELEGVEE